MSGTSKMDNNEARNTAKLQFPTSAQIQAKFELGVTLALFNWPALTLAVQSQWGGSESEAKREWFAGAICDLFATRPETDLEDVETVLLQVMFDEFEVNVEDDTAFEVAENIVSIRKKTLDGDFSQVDSLNEAWLARKGKPAAGTFKKVERTDEDDETDWDSDDYEEDEDDEGDTNMSEVTSTNIPREKPKPEVDEEGFTKVISKKR